jgi:dTDP-4-dehydrorhamnose 3,5-epimerase
MRCRAIKSWIITGGALIDGVIITPLKKIADHRGAVMHMLCADAPHFVGFGEIYFSTIHPGAVKGWHLQRKMTLNYAVPHGEILLVLYDAREKSPTYGAVQKIELGGEHYSLVTVPPGIWSGFKGISAETAIVANCASTPHDPAQAERKDPDDPAIPYDWKSAAA